jgi:light-regulated signal transduction histidine kinase (bacteriophytochrome)
MNRSQSRRRAGLALSCDPAELLDLSSAITRAVSPVHIEYLRNMGVLASLSI